MKEFLTKGHYWMTFALIIALALIAEAACACSGFYKTEYISGMNKICIYTHLGSDVAVTISNYQVCPVSIHVPH